MFAPFIVHMRRLLKGIWAKNGQHRDLKVEPGEEAEFLRWKDQLPTVADTRIDRRYFNTASYKTTLRDKTECILGCSSRHDVCSSLSTFSTKRVLTRRSICYWKIRSNPDDTSLNTPSGTTSSGCGSEVERTDSQVT